MKNNFSKESDEEVNKLKFKLPLVFAFAGLIIALVLLAFAIVKCSAKKTTYKETEDIKMDEKLLNFDNNFEGRKVAVIYFSCTGRTKEVATKLSNVFNTEAIVLEPEVPYKEEDLDYTNENSRTYLEDKLDANKEEDWEKFPKIKKIDIKKYNVIYLGYPIWYSVAPKVIYTFIKDKDLENKIIVPFCTSGSSGIGMSDQIFMNFAPESTKFMSGKNFDPSVTEEELKKWVTKLSVDFD